MLFAELRVITLITKKNSILKTTTTDYHILDLPPLAAPAASIGVLSFASDCVCLLMAFFVFSILGERKAHQPMTAQRTLIFE